VGKIGSPSFKTSKKKILKYPIDLYRKNFFHAFPKM